MSESVTFRTCALVALSSAALVAGCGNSSTDTTSGVFDVYALGIQIGELTVEGGGEEGRYTIRHQDRMTREWSEATVVGAAELAGNEAFQLPGALGDLPARMAQLGPMGWHALTAVGWPDAGTLYVRHRELEGQVEGRTTSAAYWAQQDGSRPLDLVFDGEGRLVAGIDVSNDFVMVRRGYEDFTTVAAWRDPGVSQPDYAVRVLEPVMVETEDGLGMTTFVYLPDGAEGPFPTILVRTPYGVTGFIDRYWHYVPRGYAVVLQAVRGTSYQDPAGLSEGSWSPMINEPRDGAVALDWVVSQPWSDGQICMQGASYFGYTQWAASMAENPALKCLVPEVSMGTAFSDQPFMGGGMVEGMAYYMFWMLDQTVLPDRTWNEILHHRPISDIDVFATGNEIPEWNELVEHWTNDDYWAVQDWYRSEAPRDFGTFQISGWFDDDFPGTQSNFELMQKRGTVPQRLLLGPWKHGYNFDRRLNGFSFGVDALRDDIWLLKQKWYDFFLKGVDNGVQDPVVDYFMLGVNEWRSAGAWPPEEVREEEWYFHSTGEAQRFLTDGGLSTRPPATAEPEDVFRYDPRNPAPNWCNFDLMERWSDVQSFPYDFKDIEARPDVVVFTSPPLEEDLSVAGVIVTTLYASTDVRDTDWWVHLSDVHPDNSSVRLTTGMLRARFRNLDDPVHQIFGSNFQTEELLSGDPSEVVRYEISIPSVANTFKAGHRIRIAVTNAQDNYGFPNSNTGEDEAHVARSVIGTMRIHHTPEYPSHVTLPVLPE